MLPGSVVRAVGPDHEVRKAGILLQCVGTVVSDTISSQGARLLRKRRVEIVMRGCGFYPKDLREVNKIRQSKPDVPSFESGSTRNVATAAKGGYMGSANGDEVDELVVAEIKRFVWRKLKSWRKGTIISSNIFIFSPH